MNFHRLTNLSRELTVGEINNSYDNDRNCHKFGRVSQIVSSSFLKLVSFIFNDQKQLRSKPFQDCCGNSAFKQQILQQFSGNFFDADQSSQQPLTT